MKLFTAITLTFFSFSSKAYPHEGPWTAARPDGHAPISVMGDHMHAMGEWMLSYRYMSMEMEGLLDHSNDVTKATATSKYSFGMMGNMLPKTMTMDMHMFGTMYAISDKWTFMGMFNYLDNQMTMQNNVSMESDGLGDLKLAGLYDLARWDSGRRIHLNMGISVPTGSIDEKKFDGSVLGYGMQLGSGTWDFHPAITYLAQTENYSYGLQLGGILRASDNDRGYTLGDRLESTLWGARKITDSLSTSLKLDYSSQEEIDGEDTDLNKMMSPSNRPDHQGRDLTAFGLGLNYYFQNGGLSGHRLAAEWETPIDQKVNGVQLELDSVWTIGWQYAW